MSGARQVSGSSRHTYASVTPACSARSVIDLACPALDLPPPAVRRTRTKRGSARPAGCRRWYQKGVRPRGTRDLRHQAAYLFGAVCSARDAGVALVPPTVAAAAMQVMLDELAQAVGPGAHAVVLIDRAGWHVARELAVPANFTPLFLPPYAPELNAIERISLYLRERFLSHRLWPTYDNILDACCSAWNASSPRPAASAPSAPWTGPHRSLPNGSGISARRDCRDRRKGQLSAGRAVQHTDRGSVDA